MSAGNIYKVQKVDKSYTATKHGFIQTIIHMVLLSLFILILAIYYAGIEETIRDSIEIDKTRHRWIPYSQYEPLYQEYKHDGIFYCDCSANQISWGEFTNAVEVTDDGFCNGVLFAYNACYNDLFCRNGDVGNIYYHFQDVCTKAQLLYPALPSDISPDLTSATVLADDALFTIAEGAGMS